MNAHVDIDLSDEELANVIPLKQPDPETDVERLCDLHRRGVLKYTNRIAVTKRELKEDLSNLEIFRKSVKAQFESDMAGIAQKISDAKAKADRDIAADRRLVAMSRAALEVGE